MNKETTEFIRNFSKTRTIPDPIVDLGGCETERQFSGIFPVYEVWDRRNKPDVDRTIDITIPLPKDAVSYAATLICTDTLEHIWEFRTAIKNMGSIVKQNGLIILTMPFEYGHHDISGDFWRFTHQALERLFSDDFNKLESGYFPVTGGRSSYYIGSRK